MALLLAACTPGPSVDLRGKQIAPAEPSVPFSEDFWEDGRWSSSIDSRAPLIALGIWSQRGDSVCVDIEDDTGGELKGKRICRKFVSGDNGELMFPLLRDMDELMAVRISEASKRNF